MVVEYSLCISLLFICAGKRQGIEEPAGRTEICGGEVDL